MRNVLRFAEAVVDLERREVCRGSSVLPLTELETELLTFFEENPNRDLDREELLKRVWGYRGVNSRAADYAVRRLRAKVERDPSEPAHILTVTGVGYRYLPPSVPAPTSELPLEVDRFFGRISELERLRAIADPARLWTCTGPSEAGKTRLAQHFLLKSGMDLVHLDVARDPAGVQTLGRVAAENAEGLVFLDNVPLQLRRQVALVVAACLREHPLLRFVVTCRAPLDIRGENVLPLGPMSQTHALDLYGDRASLRDPCFDAELHRVEVVQLVDQLDALPGLIEQAASRVAVFPPGVYASRLGSAPSPAQEEVWQSLGAEERRAARRLAPIEGPFDVGLADDLSVSADLVQTLLRWGILFRSATTGGPVFSMYAGFRSLAQRMDVDQGRTERIL